MDIAASCTGHVYILPDGSLTPPPPLRNSLHNYGNYNNIIMYKFIFSICLDVQNKHWLGCYSDRMAREINSSKINVSIWQEGRT